MAATTPKFKFSYTELLFQIVLHLLVFIFYSFDRNQPQIQWVQVVFFSNYVVAALIINYVLLPRFYYRKKTVLFLVSVAAVLLAVIYVEEMILEEIYYPDTRGGHFSGIFYALLDVMPVIVILCGFKFAWDAFRKQKELDALQETIRESELQFLKSQVNPHFLFNNLNNLYAHAIEQSPKVPEIILELSSVLRYVLYECRAEYVSLSREVEQLESFVGLSELQIEERGRVRFTADIADGFQIAPLILIMFVENAFKHSTASQASGIDIEIRLQVSASGHLKFYCKNSFQEQSNTESLGRGIGLENVRKRLELLYPDAHALAIEKSENEYAVQLSMDLTKSTRP
ncbi:MAG: histidine kinase [Phaeodactylibacter sp.]|nr:histidine kinase [Phaeodactylibacter sp.]